MFDTPEIEFVIPGFSIELWQMAIAYCAVGIMAARRFYRKVVIEGKELGRFAKITPSASGITSPESLKQRAEFAQKDSLCVACAWPAIVFYIIIVVPLVMLTGKAGQGAAWVYNWLLTTRNQG